MWFFYFFGALIVLTPKMNEAKRRKAAGDESGCRAIVDRYVPMWMSTLMRIAGCTVTVNGLENIPKDRAVVFTPNHQSDYDIPITLEHLDTGFPWLLCVFQTSLFRALFVQQPGGYGDIPPGHLFPGKACGQRPERHRFRRGLLSGQKG